MWLEVLGCAQPRAEELRENLTAAAGPHRERRGSAELCSVWQRQGPKERHGAVSGEEQWELGTGSASEGGQALAQAAQGSGHRSEPAVVQGMFAQYSRTKGLNVGWSRMEPGAGLDNPCRYSMTLFYSLFEDNKLGGKTLKVQVL